LLQAVDVLVFTSGYEGLPIALLEGMAAARCIVGTDAPGILDAVRDHREALIVPVGDPDRLRCALEQALADPALRKRLGAAARCRFLEEFTAERMVARYEQVYQEVSGEGARQSGEGRPPVAHRFGNKGGSSRIQDQFRAGAR
jgi:glycosyltransferase involved in cell wall biosynthesis